MDIYNLPRAGFALDITTPIFQQSDIRGFFRKVDLQIFLAVLDNMEEDYAGLRFYNLSAELGSPKIIAGGAKEDGFDIFDTYLVSQDAIGDKNHMAATTISDRSICRMLTMATPVPDRYLSYLSKTEIIALLSNDVDGIGFCEITLDAVPASVLTENKLDHLVNIRSVTRTNIAVAMNLDDDNKIPLAPFNAASDNLVSMTPCPGHCLDKKINQVEGVRSRFPSRAAFDESNDPYLFPWHDG